MSDEANTLPEQNLSTGTPPATSSWKDLGRIAIAAVIVIVIVCVVSIFGGSLGLKPPSPSPSPAPFRDDRPARPRPTPVPVEESFMNSQEPYELPRELTHNAQEIQPRLFLGPQTVAENREWLRKQNITHILNMGAEVQKTFPDIEYSYVDIEDAPWEPIAKWFPMTYDFIERGRSAPNRILVHCAAGISRSASVLCAYLMRKNNWDLPQTLLFLRARRECVNPNPGFLSQLAQYDKYLQRQRSV